jgi:hypothetical protein
MPRPAVMEALLGARRKEGRSCGKRAGKEAEMRTTCLVVARWCFQ